MTRTLIAVALCVWLHACSGEYTTTWSEDPFRAVTVFDDGMMLVSTYCPEKCWCPEGADACHAELGPDGFICSWVYMREPIMIPPTCETPERRQEPTSTKEL